MNSFNIVNSAIISAISAVIAGAVFLFFRVLVLWYWRVGEIVSLLEEIRDRLPEPPAEVKSTERTKPKPKIKCAGCGTKQDVDDDTRYCDQCGASLQQ